MRDRSKKLLVINTGKKESGQTRLPAQSGTTHIIGGGGLSVNMSDYLLKSIWDKVFEIRTDSQGTEYIFGKLPVVTQYGITMYSGEGVNVPSLASGLPFDGRTIWYNPDTQQIEVIGGTGGGSGEGVSNFWDLSGIPYWITNSKPKYTYSEIEGTPDLTKYALASQIPSLSGYATESWVAKQNYATKATTLSGYGITDAYTKTNVDDLLKSYVTLGGKQTITGEKNFVGGLKVNGSPIYYDTDKKYWKLEGDLLVTGGVTMYGSDSSFTPSTIMDAIAVDGTTISKSGGVLKVIGGTGGGVADSVAWANITGKPTWIGSSKPSYSYSEITGAISTTELQNYLTSNSYLNVTGGDNRYLKLSGGTMTGNILLGGTTTNKIGTNIVDTTSWQEFTHQNSHGYIAIGPFNDSVAHIYTDRPTFYFNKELYVNGAKVWNAGNDGSGSTMDADMLDGKHNGELTAIMLHSGGGSVLDANEIKFSDYALRFFGGIPDTSTNFPTLTGYSNGLLALPIHSNGATAQLYFTVGKNPYYRSHHTYEWNELAYKTDNVASATKLQTARTIWGQSFDGTGNVSGNLTLENNYEIVTKNISGSISSTLYRTKSNNLSIGEGIAKESNDTYISGYNLFLRYGTGLTNGISLISSGNVGIGTTSPSYKLDVNGVLRATAAMFGGDSGINIGMTYKNDTTGAYDLIERKLSGSMLYLQYNHNGGINMCQGGGNVGIGTISPEYKLAVNGDSVTNNVRTNSVMFGYSDVSSNITSNRWYYASITYADEGKSPSYLNPALVFKTMNNTYQSGTEVERMRICSNGNLSVGYAGDKGSKLYVDGNILAYGGITMYSDQRKKTILNHVELSLKQIADAPLIEHYYNSDEKKTTHVGSIAQYWASMNDWFCKLDSEGYYIMEIQNAALASAISIARELDRYETKTDKAIKKLKKRISELEDEVERLKSA